MEPKKFEVLEDRNQEVPDNWASQVVKIEREGSNLYRGTRMDTGQVVDLNGRYTFVVIKGTNPFDPDYGAVVTYASLSLHHHLVARQQPVDYAGTVEFANNRVRYWLNTSGHYQPGLSDWLVMGEHPFSTGRLAPWSPGRGLKSALEGEFDYVGMWRWGVKLAEAMEDMGNPDW